MYIEARLVKFSNLTLTPIINTMYRDITKSKYSNIDYDVDTARAFPKITNGIVTMDGHIYLHITDKNAQFISSMQSIGLVELGSVRFVDM